MLSVTVMAADSKTLSSGLSELVSKEKSSETVKEVVKESGFDSIAGQLKTRDLRVLAKPGSSTTAVSSALRLTPENFKSLVQNKVALVEKVETKPEVVEHAGATVWQSPFRVLMPKSEREPDQVWTLRPIVRVLQALQYDEPNRQFRAQLSVGVIDENQPRLRRALAVPFTIDVASDTLRSVSPQTVQFDRSADFKTVEIFDNAPPQPAVVRVLLAGDDANGSEVELPVRRPSLQLTLNPNRILGMGLETAQVTVNAVGLRHPEGMTVSLGTDSGRFKSPVLTLDAQGLATTTLRSSGLGAANIEASGTPFDTASSSVRFALPWTFLIATLFGGLVGALATRSGRAKLINTAITGVATGLISAVLYAVGINVVGFEPAAQVGEAVTFAIAALGSVLGPGILDKSKALRGGDAVN